MKSRKKFLTSVRLYPKDAMFLKEWADDTERTMAYYIQEAVSQFVRAEKDRRLKIIKEKS